MRGRVIGKAERRNPAGQSLQTSQSLFWLLELRIPDTLWRSRSSSHHPINVRKIAMFLEFREDLFIVADEKKRGPRFTTRFANERECFTRIAAVEISRRLVGQYELG